ncbi:MAG: DUF4249 domain-containing protein [Bacteroidota bacterium]
MGLMLFSCVEEFEAKTPSFDSILVIDATLTDELKTQEVKLGRTSPLENDTIVSEGGAQVSIVDDQGFNLAFNETDSGTYHSSTIFAAVAGRSYTLSIVTADGKRYSSEATMMPQAVDIGGIEAKRMTNGFDQEGVGIFLDAEAVNKDAFLRYEYDETYKIIAPRWEPFDFEVVHYIACDTIPYQVDRKLREEEQRVCFGTASSTRVIQASTIDLEGTAVEGKEIRFVSRDNYIISHRYSINVKQFTQTPEAYYFYNQLEAFSSSESIFSQVQPGFLEGNVFSQTSANEQVLGYFEVAAVRTKRLYMNYADLFPEEPLPPYPFGCGFIGNPPLYSEGYHCDGYLSCDGDCSSPLIEAILADQITFGADNEEDPFYPFFTWPRGCGDCTLLGSNVVPEFWIEE